MIMKKAIFTIMAVLAVFAIVGCSNGSTDSGKGPDGPTGPTTYSYTVTFDKNTNDEGSTAPVPATRTVNSPNTTVSQLPNTAPTRPGYIFQGYNTSQDGSGTVFLAGAAGSGTAVTASITVYAQWRQGFKVTFDKNTDDSNCTEADPTEMDVIRPATTIAGLPQPPVREAYAFKGWYKQAEFAEDEDPEDFKFDETTQVDAHITVYAAWEFVGGTPELVNGKIVVNRPFFDVKASDAELNADGTYKLVQNGTLDFEFPIVEGEDASTFDYFVIATQINSGENGGSTNVQFMSLSGGSESNWGGSYTNEWLSNLTGQKIIRYVSGMGTDKVFRIRVPGGTAVAKLTIISITFYKLPLYTVTFNYGTWAGAPPNVTVDNVVGKDENLPGSGVTAAKWPGDPDRESETPPMFFLGWYDETVTPNVLYDPSMSIAKNTTLTAQFTATEPEKVEKISTLGQNGVPVYNFKLPEEFSDLTSGVSKVTFTVWVDDPDTLNTNNNSNGRLIVVDGLGKSDGVGGDIPFALTDSPGNPIGRAQLSNWGDYRLLQPFAGNKVPDILKAGKLADGTSEGVGGAWVTFTYNIGPVETNIDVGKSSAVKYSLMADKKDIYLGLGITNNDSSGGGLKYVYYIKDVAVILVDGTRVPNSPLDDFLWQDDVETVVKLGQLSFVANGNDPITRSMAYTPDR
jgi:uncharacterized repeat protein (TIGR02543 family)